MLIETGNVTAVKAKIFHVGNAHPGFHDCEYMLKDDKWFYRIRFQQLKDRWEELATFEGDYDAEGRFWIADKDHTVCLKPLEKTAEWFGFPYPNYEPSTTTPPPYRTITTTPIPDYSKLAKPRRSNKLTGQPVPSRQPKDIPKKTKKRA